jgi:acyl-CoA thioesterase-1
MWKKNTSALLLSMLTALSVSLLPAAACAQTSAAPPPASGAPRIVIYGDSLSAGYGLRQGAAWPNLLQERLTKNKLNYIVVNASISGETSAGGAARIAATMRDTRPAVLVVALGANDGLRGLPVAQLRDNLAAIVKAAKAGHSKVVLVGMKMPPNYGPQYTEQFQRSFSDLAREQKLALVPFLLEGVVQRADLFQQDQLHPTEEAQNLILENVWKGLQKLLRS